VIGDDYASTTSTSSTSPWGWVGKGAEPIQLFVEHAHGG
jgi:hypothetical protein